MSDPEQIKQDIESTRAQLSGDVNALTEKVSPGRIVGRKVQRTRNAVTSVKQRVMGSDSDSDSAGALSSAASSVADTASSVTDAASSAPAAVRQQTEGNPLAAALIAFGVGWLASSILPASRSEQQLAAQVKDKATDLAQPVLQEAKQAGQEVASNLQEPAQQAVEQVRSTAQDAANTVTEQAKGAAGDVKDEAQAQTSS
jgi:ElaB/YqjD/DUF883 family membrane-anchored ribosome-binding protein